MGEIQDRRWEGLGRRVNKWTRVAMEDPNKAPRQVNVACLLTDAETLVPVVRGLMTGSPKGRGATRLICGVLSARECRSLIKCMKERQSSKLEGFKATQYAMLDDPLAAAELFSRVRYFLPQALKTSEGDTWTLFGINEQLEVLQFSQGAACEARRDKGIVTDRPNRTERGFLKMVLFLSDCHVPPGRPDDFDGEGGAFCFLSNPESVEPMIRLSFLAGQMVVFDQDSWFRFEPLLRGTAYLLRADILFMSPDGSISPDTERRRGSVDGYGSSYFCSPASQPDIRPLVGFERFEDSDNWWE